MDSVMVLVMIGALTLAVVLSAFAWIALRRDRRRAEIRVSRLQALASEPARELSFDDPSPEPSRLEPADLPLTPPSSGLFAEPTRTRAPRWGLTAAVVVVFLAAGAGTVYGLYGPPLTSLLPARSSAASTEPVELVSLGHRREAADFVVTGLLQNPDPAASTPPLTAVVFLFDADGQFLTSAKAAIDTGIVPAGDLTPFTIRVSAPGKVSRYRVGFRRADGAVYAHVDRRAAGISGTTVATVEETR